MNEKKSKKWAAVLALLIANLAVSGFIIIYLFVPAGESSAGDGRLVFSGDAGQYILYIGTNDKDTYEQIIPTDEARKIVNGICAKYVEGYTSSEASGGWVDEKGVLTQENTLIYTFTGAGEEELIKIMDEVLVSLNQNSVLIEKKDVSSAFYNGAAS